MRPTVVIALFILLRCSWAGGDDFESRVTEFTLKNGLQVIVYVDSSAPVVTTSAFYRVGSYDEQTGYTGISHMVEHMSFKHTDIYKPGEFFRIVSEAGGFNNGFTSTYFTGYFEDFARERWELALKLEASRMARCIFPDSEFESEHQVVTEERRLHENRPQSAFWELFEANALLANPQRNPTVGWADDVDRFSARAVRDWYQQHYNPANAVLAVAGDVRAGEVRAKVERYFGKLKGTARDRADYYNVEPKQTGERRLVLRRKVKVPSLHIAYHIPGIRDSSFVTGPLVASILTDGRTSRLHKALVIDSGLVTSIWASGEVERDPGIFGFYVTPKAESLIPRIIAIIDRELERMKNELVTDRELERVRNRALASYLFARDDISDMAIILSALQITTGSWRSFKDYIERFMRVSKENIRDYCRDYLKSDNRLVGILASEEER
jgi:zinc protease